MALKSRRSTFERTLWTLAAAQPGLTFRSGFVTRIETERERARGIAVDGSLIAADLVIMAAGRVSHLGDEYRAPVEGGPCGHAYITRMYRALDGVEAPDTPLPITSAYRGYIAIVFPQDDRTFSTLIHAPANDNDLATLCRPECWEIAVRAIPQLAQWTAPDQFQPITEVMRGGLLTNTYRGQMDSDGNMAIAGLIFVGDAVSTTNPALGRGISLGLLQAAELVRLLAHDADDIRGVASQFDAWCTDHIRPWYDEQVQEDAALLASATLRRTQPRRTGGPRRVRRDIQRSRHVTPASAVERQCSRGPFDSNPRGWQAAGVTAIARTTTATRLRGSPRIIRRLVEPPTDPGYIQPP